jgi:O-antigen biosynthesis protein WbqP
MINRIIAIILLLLFLLPILFILLVTLIDLRCNPVFKQFRTVDGSKYFQIYKIRTMRQNAPQVQTGLLLQPELFITKFGAFVRKSSMDELLNLVSIAKGDMDFIGPRPVMSSEIEIIGLRRNCGIIGKGGVTGFAQINGRDLITLTRKIAAERYYKQNRSFKLDLFIFYKTLHVVFNRSGIAH